MKTWALILAASLTVPGVALAQENSGGETVETPPAGVTDAELSTPVDAETGTDAQEPAVLADNTGMADTETHMAEPEAPSDVTTEPVPETEASDDEASSANSEEETPTVDAEASAPDAADDMTAKDAPETEMAEDAPDSADEVTEATPVEEPASAEDAVSDTEEMASGDVEALETPAATEPEPTAPEPVEPDPLALAAEACLAIAGTPDAGVPAAKVDAAAQKETLARAAADCSKAAMAEDADPAVLFHAAAVAQARGNPGETFTLLTRAAEGGLGAAETRLGDYFLFGVGPQGQDIATAVTHYKTAAELGDAPGMTTLALLYQVARGVPRDTGRMVALMTGAAEQGYHFAQYRLAQTYLRGEGVPGRRDATLGIPEPAKAVTYYIKAAQAGNLSAALELAALYDDPSSGLPDDPDAQLTLLRIVAETGHAPSIARIGTFYEMGRGVTYNPSVAAAIYVRALETGDIAVADVRNGAPAAWDRETALAFQVILQERGLYDGALDAIIGPGTRGAAARLADQ